VAQRRSLDDLQLWAYLNDRFGGRYTSLQRLESALNQAIAQAEISESYEEYLEIFVAFYADDIAVTSDILQGRVEERRESAHFWPTSLRRFM
jgi:hypothetical protein